MENDPDHRPLIWMGSSKRDLMDMPEDVVSDFGFGLYQAQIGKFPDIGKTLSGFGNADVVELKLECEGDAFRAVYTIQFSEFVVVLHAFQKKSMKGKETPKKDKELIESRLKAAVQMYKEFKAERKK